MVYEVLFIYIVSSDLLIGKLKRYEPLNVYKMEFIRTYMIERASSIIMETEPIDVKNEYENIYIRKNTFEATEKEPYYEDYCVVFELNIIGYRYTSTFYLQWYDEILDSSDELSIKKTRLL